MVDIGAGAGHLALLLRRQHPSTRLLGLEPDAGAVAGRLAVWAADALLGLSPGRGRSRFGGLFVAVAHEPR